MYLKTYQDVVYFVIWLRWPYHLVFVGDVLAGNDFGKRTFGKGQNEIHEISFLNIDLVFRPLSVQFSRIGVGYPALNLLPFFESQRSGKALAPHFRAQFFGGKRRGKRTHNNKLEREILLQHAALL